MSNQPLTEDLGISVFPSMFLLGTMNVSARRAEFGSLTIQDCAVSLTSDGLFNIALVPLDLQFKQFDWQYEMLRWPHFADSGHGAGSISTAFNITVDMQKEEVTLAHMELDFFNVDMGATRHTWLTSLLMNGVNMMRPLVSAVLGQVFTLVLKDTVAFIKTQGGCAFMDGILAKADLTTITYTSEVPVSVQVPLVGNVDISVNSTYVRQPKSMDCKHVGFSGSTLEAHIENIPFSTGFNWAYRKPGSFFWHNRGTGSADVVAGSSVHINVLKPEETAVQIALPALYLNIDAESNHWLYGALTYVMVPLVRESLQLLGGKFAAYEIKQCLADPLCPRSMSNGKAAGLQEHPRVQQVQPAASDLVIV